MCFSLVRTHWRASWEPLPAILDDDFRTALMTLLVLGLAIFIGGHAFTMARGRRDMAIKRLGENGFRMAYSAASIIGIALIIYGFGQYRATGWVNLWHPPVWTKHLALLLTLPVFILLAAASSNGRIHAAAKHPTLLAVKIWATAHLIANGDLGGMLLFGSFLGWAVAARISMKGRADAVAAPVAGFTQRDYIAIAAGLVIWFAFAYWLHPLLIGVAVWPGR